MTSETEQEARAGVILGLANPRTVDDIARLAVAMARYHRTSAVAVTVIHTAAMEPLTAPRLEDVTEQRRELFEAARRAFADTRLPLITETRIAQAPADGILAAARDHAAEWIILGHPRHADADAFDAVVEAVAKADIAHVIVARISYPIPTWGRILVPVTHPSHLADCAPVANAIAGDCGKALVLDIIGSDATDREVEEAKAELDKVARQVMPNCYHEVRRAESRVHAILEASAEADMVLLRADDRKGLSRLFFGSLASEIAERVDCTVLMLHPRHAS